VELSDYRDFAGAGAQLGGFLEEVYQRKRIHSALGSLTPVEFEAASQAAHTPPVVIPEDGAFWCPSSWAQYMLHVRCLSGM
jgi:hypothetical protein